MTVEVKAKLTLDDAASAALDRIKRGFSDADASSKGASSSMGFFKSTLSTIAAVNFVPAIQGLARFATGFIEAAANARDADQAIAGMITAVQGLPWSEAHTGAMKIGDEIDDIAISIGQNIGEVRSAFGDLLIFTGATAEGTAKARTQIEQLTTIANVMGMDTRTIAMEFGAMGDGVIRTRGKLFQLLQTTGIFSSDITKVSTEWAKLTNEQRATALAGALETVSGKMGKAVPTFHDLTNTLGNLWEVTKERFAEPIIDVLIDELRVMIPLIKDGSKGVEQFAKSMAEDVRKWVKDAGVEIRKGFEYLRTHSEEIKAAIVDGAKTAKSVVEFIIANRELIAIAFGAKMAAPVVSAGANVASGVVGLAAKGAPGIGMAAGAAGAAGAVAALAAFAAAIAAVTLALWQFQKLMAETGGGKSEGERDQLAREQYFKDLAAKQSYAPMSKEELAGFTHIRKQYVDTAVALGKSGRAAGEFADRAWKAHTALRAQVTQYEQAANAIKKIEDTGQGDLGAQQLASTVSLLEQGWTTAMAEGRTGAAKYIASLIAGSANLREAFGESANLTTEGFTALADQVKSQSEDFANRLKERGAEAKPKTEAKTPKPGVHMSGGQTFNIKQDFRDQDPDRVAIVFERDIVRAAESRLQAVTSTPFGT